MSKLKRDLEMPEVASSSSRDEREPERKRKRVALNFSIESIMQSSDGGEQPQQQQRSSPEDASGSKIGAAIRGAIIAASAAANLAPFGTSRVEGANIVPFGAANSPSISGSSAISPNSRSSSPVGRLSHSPPTSISDSTQAGSASGSNQSSRASTPISPGGNPNGRCSSPGQLAKRRQPISGTTTTNNHNHQQTASGKSVIGKRHSSSSSGANSNHNNSNNNNSSNHSSSHSTWSKERSGGSTNQLLRQQVCHDPRLAPFECHLDNLDLWHRFHPLDTEMIITKQGRRMFPPVRVTFSLGADGCGSAGGGGAANSTSGQQQHQSSNVNQLNPRDKYQVLMDILPYDNKRYRYAYHKSSWQQAGKADPPSPTKLFLHPDGPFTLDQLKRQVISFEKIKLTNNDANKHGYIVLNSMHKYQPRIHLVLWRGKESQSLANAPISLLEQETHKTFIFSETIFTAVTAYQNHSITKLKIDSNPFAKGFRDSSRLTDLELETMQDLMSAEGQCPFSPPRAPPHGFPHFLFAAAAQQQQQSMGPGGQPQMVEDPASALLRERTIMALDSFLQQQQQHQQQSAGSPQRPGGQQLQHQTPQQQQQQQSHSGPPPYGQPPNLFGSFVGRPPGGANLEQLILQQQQIAAAAMAAAAAAGAQHPFGGLFGPPPTSGGPQHLSPGCGGGGNGAPSTPTKSGSPGLVRTCQLSPPQQQQAAGGKAELGQFNAGPPCGATGQLGAPNSHHLPPPYFHPQHLQAVLAAHHQHQMATLSMQLHQQQQDQQATANQQHQQQPSRHPQQHQHADGGGSLATMAASQQIHHHHHHLNHQATQQAKKNL